MKTFKTLAFLFLVLVSQNAVSQCWTQIAAGDYHTVAIKSDGTLWAWGLNDKGQLGDGTTVNKNVPTQIGTDTDWATIDALANNSLALKIDGSLWAWGDNYGGQNGNGNHGTGAINTIPTQVGTSNDWLKITSGALRTFALKSNGTLWGWGQNLEGYLGTGEFTNHYTPIQIGSAIDWLDVDAGGNNVLAIKTNHTLWGWGLNKAGSLAIGIPDIGPIITVPTQTGNNSADWLKISAGICCSTKMIKTDGSLWAMGGIGNLGNVGNGGTANVNTPTLIGTGTDWNSVSTSNHTAATKNNGSLWIWGSNFGGQLGDGTFINRTNPFQIGTDKTWLSVKTGTFHTVALSSDNTLYAWGWNNYGQLGDGTFVEKNVITQIGNSCPLITTEFNLNESLQVYPNPTSSTSIIRYHLLENAKVTIVITNNLGQIVFQKIKPSALGENLESIDLSTYGTGVYFITVNTYNQQATIKVIKH